MTLERSSGRGGRIAAGLGFVASLCLAAPAAAQDGFRGEAMAGIAPEVDEATIGLRHGSTILAPIPIRNPTVGTGLALGAGYLFALDAGSDPSFLGVGGFRTDNGSTGNALGAKLAFDEGRWELHGAVGDVDLVYDLYVLGVPVEIGQRGAMAWGGVSYGLTDRLSLGVDLTYIESELGFVGGTLPEGLAGDFGISTATADLVLAWDSRDDTIYPTSGVNAEIRLGGGQVVERPDRDFRRSSARLAAFLPASDLGVVAGQLALCDVSDPTPFFLSCSLGGSDAFRGYPSTQNLGDSLVSAQLAWRGHLAWRFGYEVFAGAGRVAGDFAGLGEAETLAAAGVGLRLRVSRRFPVDFSVDVAVNLDEETTSYIYVGQRF